MVHLLSAAKATPMSWFTYLEMLGSGGSKSFTGLKKVTVLFITVIF